MGLAKTEAELKALAADFKATLTKAQTLAKEGIAFAKKHSETLRKLTDDLMDARQKVGSETAEAVKAAQAKKLSNDDSYTLDIMQQLDFYVGGVWSAFAGLQNVLEENENYWLKDLTAAAAAFEKAAKNEVDLRKKKWAATFKPPKAGDTVRWGGKKGVVQKVEDRPYGRLVSLKFEGESQLHTWPEHMLAGGDFKFYE
jgi:uncharacterized protein (DUF885 family)